MYSLLHVVYVFTLQPFLRTSGLRARSDAETVQRIHLAIAEVTTFPLPEIKKKMFILQTNSLYKGV